MNDATYETKDLYESAFIGTRCRLLGTRPGDGRIFFIFNNKNGTADTAALDFLNGTVVNVREYLSCLQRFRSLAFSSRDHVRLQPLAGESASTTNSTKG